MNTCPTPPGLYVMASSSSEATPARALPRVFQWLQEAATTAGRALFFSPCEQPTRGCDCLVKHIDLPFELDPVARWELHEPTALEHLELATSVARWKGERLERLVRDGALFGAKDIIGGVARVAYIRDGRDHLCVSSLARGRQVEFYVCCAGSCRDEYEAYMEAQKARASTPNLRMVSRHSENIILPRQDDDGPERLIVKPSALEVIALALRLVLRLYSPPATG